MGEISGTNYTIKSGDSLWNIVKSNYKAADGSTLKNGDIQQIVNKIANANSNIKDANTIIAGDSIVLPPIDTIEYEEEDTESKYAQLNQWLNGSHNKAFNFNAKNTSSPISDGAKELAEAQMKAFDTDGNGTIDYEEFASATAKGLHGADFELGNLSDEEHTAIVNTYNFLDVNNELGIQRKELTGFYKIADDYKGADGKITYDTFQFFANNMKADETEREFTSEQYKEQYAQYYPNDMKTHEE